MNRTLNSKILFISSWYPTRIHDFNGDFVKRHARAVSLFSQVTCLHVIYDKDLKNKRFEIVESKEDNLNEIIIYFKPFLDYNFFRKLIKVGYYFKGFRYIKMKFGKPDIIHANVLVPIGFTAFSLSLFFQTPFVITEHWTGFLNGSFNQKPWIIRKLYSFISKKARCILPVTENLSIAMQNCGIKAVYKVVPNVVETGIFKIKDFNIPEIKQIIHVSDLNDEHKNVSGLLRAIKSLSEIRQDFILQIIHNQDNQLLFDYTEELGINKRFVNFLGKKNSVEVAEIMSDSSFLVLFSNYENLPCVIVEALACGIPVLSTNVGGINEYIDSSKGILIEKGNEQELIKQLNYLLDNFKNYKKEDLHHFSVTHFSYDKIGNDLFNTYQSILND